MKFLWDHAGPIVLGVVMCYYWLTWRGVPINWWGMLLGITIGHILYHLYLRPLF